MENPKPSMSYQVMALLVVQIILKLRVLITMPILTTSLGLGGYGILAAFLSLNAFLQNFLMLGTNTSLTVIWHYTKNERDKAIEFWGLVLFLLCFSFVGVFAGYLFTPILYPYFNIPSSYSTTGILALALMPLTILVDIFQTQLTNTTQGHRLPKLFALTGLTELILIIILTPKYGINGLFTSMLIGLGIQAIFLGYINNTTTPFIFSGLNQLKRLRPYFIYGVVPILTGLMSWILDSSDRLLLTKFLGLDEAGSYQAAYSIGFQSIQVFGTPIFTALMPFLAKAIANNDSQRAEDLLGRTLKLLLILICPIVISSIFLSNSIMSILANKSFVSGHNTIPWIMLAGGFFMVQGVFNFSLHSHKKGHLILIPLFIGGLINISGNILLLEQYGKVAAAWTTSIGYGAAAFTSFMLSRQYQKISFRTNFLLKLAGALIPLVISWQLINILTIKPVFQLIFGGFIFIIFYPTILFLLKVIDSEDIKQIRDIYKRKH